MIDRIHLLSHSNECLSSASIVQKIDFIFTMRLDKESLLGLWILLLMNSTITGKEYSADRISFRRE